MMSNSPEFQRFTLIIQAWINEHLNEIPTVADVAAVDQYEAGLNEAMRDVVPDAPWITLKISYDEEKGVNVLNIDMTPLAPLPDTIDVKVIDMGDSDALPDIDWHHAYERNDDDTDGPCA